MNVSVVGLGKLGLPFAFFLASYGNKVFAIDKNKKVKETIDKNIKITEPNLNTYIRKYKKNFTYSEDINILIKETNITFLVLPTPSKKDGSFSNSFVLSALKEISSSLINKKNRNHLIVITSTVSPGSCENIFIPFLKKNNLKNGKDFSLVYNPHFIAQGTTIHNLEKPDFLLIGTDSPKTKKNINKFYSSIYKNKEIFKNTNLKEGEISKISINSYITTKISFANYISELCEKIEGADAQVVLDVIGEDKRIRHSYLKIGTKFSGPCFPRDNLALKNFSNKKKVNALIPTMNDKINSLQTDRIIAILKKIMKKEKKPDIGILGLTYKTDTNLINNSQGDDLIKLIKKNKINYNKINIFDKFLDEHDIKKYDKEMVYIKNLNLFLKRSTIIFMMYKDDTIKIKNKSFGKQKKYFIDCWRSFNSIPKPFKLISPGKQNNI